MADLAGRAAELKDRGLTQAKIAAELGVSQQRVSQLLNGTDGHRHASTSAAPSASTSAALSASTSAALSASTSELIEQARAEQKAADNARFRPHWEQAQQTIAELTARVAELEAAGPVAGRCPRHRVALVPLCPRCEGLDPGGPA